MKRNNFKLNSISMAMLVAASASTYAAETPKNYANKDIEVIQVTGIASSLSKSAAMKRDASGVVDAISAEDIGKFPDTNLAESLQRITGVSIDRSNNEGNQVTVRGFGPAFNLVTLNGRQMPNSSALVSAGIPRSFNFKEIGAETVSAVEVHKTGRADINSGGIGATINIHTAKPFAYDGFKAIGSVKGVFDSSVDTGSSVTPELSGMVSNTFLDDTFGVLVSLSHAERDSHTDRIGTSGQWTSGAAGSGIDTSNIDTTKNPTSAVYKVPTVDFSVQDTERERQNAQVVLQWAPTDSVVATFDYVMSRLDEKSKMNRSSYWFDSIDSGTADANGTIINPMLADDELNFWAWEYAYKTENDSVGLNVEWQVNDSLSLTFDAHDSTSHANPGGLAAERLANMKNPKFDHDNNSATPDEKLVGIGADFSGDTPSISYDDSRVVALTGNGAWHKSNIVGDLIQERGYEIENNIQQVAVSGRWENLNDSPLIAVNFGYSNTVYDVDTTKFSGAVWNTSVLDLTNLDVSTTPGGLGFDSVIRYSADQFIELTKQQNLYVAPSESINGIEEDTDAFYVSADFELEISGMPLKANLGVRHEATDVTSYSVGKPVVGLHWGTDLEMSKVESTEEASESLTGDYDHYLPSLNVSLDINDSLVTRFSYSKTISRSSIDSMFPGTTLNTHLAGGPFRAGQGNPNLLPYEATNIDLSLEWYYAEGSYASIGYFDKDVDNFIFGGEIDKTIEGPNGVITDPSVNPRSGCPDFDNPDCASQPTDPAIIWRVSAPVNLDKVAVDGWEFNIQHMFGDTGFGAVANYTFVDSDGEYDIYNLNNDTVLGGLSDSANLVGFYEKDNYSIRIAYNWRDDFLLTAGNSPVFTEAYSQIDISANYDINDTVSVFVEGINITEEDTRRHGRFSNQIVDSEQYGARYTVGVRAQF